MSKYVLDPELKKVSRMNSVSMSPFVLSLASLYLKNTYKCLKKMSHIRYEIITMKGGYHLYVIIPDDLDDAEHPCIIDYHGGGFIYRGWDNHFYNPGKYAKKTKSIVVYSDYRLAYNTEYGTTLQDCIDTYLWVIENHGKYHIDLTRLILCGDSAGGYLALKVNEYIHEHDLVKPKGLLLIYPVVDPDMRSDSMKKFTDTPVWDAPSNHKMWEYYLHGHQETSPLDKDLSYIENCYIELTEFDCLHDEGYLLYEKLKNNGHVILNETEKTCHGYDIDTTLKIVADAIEKRCQFLNEIYSL